MSSGLSLYVRDWCGYCTKVRTAMKGLGIEIPLRDIGESHHRDVLLRGGGKTQVPCLRIEHVGGKIEWMYESDDIIRYLQAHAA